MAAYFYPSWVSVLDESIQEWNNRYTCPGRMFVPHKPHPFGEKYHTIECSKSKFVGNVEIVEGKSRPRVIGKKKFQENRDMDGFMVSITKKLWRIGKVTVMDSGFCVLEILI